MTATVQAETSQIKPPAPYRRVLGIMVLVLFAHAAVMVALAILKPVQYQVPPAPKPIAVRFVHIAPLQYQVPPAPKPIAVRFVHIAPPEPKPTLRPEPPKLQPKPKEVNIIKEPPKPKPLPKPKPVLATPTPSLRPQAVAPLQPEPETVTVVKQTRAEPVPLSPTPTPKAEPRSEPQPPTEPVQIEGVSYIKPPRLEVTDRDLKGQPRTVMLKIFISPAGRVDEVQVINSSGLGPLDQKVVRALKRAKFSPHRINGVAVPAYTVQPFVFQLSR
ncbi:energy transducer TonB [Alkanindiges sp. WGS2144]|uniref:energy transducer TonB n=1 Tax=Alkanindiges sp. WGS2144 TaxID=3366808 RepID=UPI0037538A54